MAQTCEVPKFDRMNKEQKSASAKDLLDAAGVQACEQNNTQSSFHAEMNVDIPFANANASLSGATSTTTNVGCEQIYASAKKFSNAVQDIACNILKDKQEVSINSQTINSFQFAVGCSDPDVQLAMIDAGCTGDCYAKACAPSVTIGGSIIVNQKTQVNILSKINLSSSAISKIEEKAKTVVKTLLGVDQDSKTGAGATPQASKVLNELSSENVSQSIKKAITDTSKSIMMKIDTGNKVTMYFPGEVNIKGDLIIDQDACLKLASTAILSSAVKAAASSVRETIQESNSTIKQKSVNKAPPNAFDGKPKKDKNMWDIIGWAIAGVVIIVVLYFIFGRKKKNNFQVSSLKSLT